MCCWSGINIALLVTWTELASESKGIPVYLKENSLHAESKKSSIDYWRVINASIRQQQHQSASRITIIPDAKAESNGNNISKMENRGQTIISSSGAGTVGRPGVAVDSYPIGVAVNPVTKNVYIYLYIDIDSAIVRDFE